MLFPLFPQEIFLDSQKNFVDEREILFFLKVSFRMFTFYTG